LGCDGDVEASFEVLFRSENIIAGVAVSGIRT
jgi:hypothetical protein